eukprot:s2415_g8.t1
MFEFPLVTADSSDSWSLETPETSSSSEGEMSLGGGEREEVPNIGAGGSYPGTSPQLHRLQGRAPMLRKIHSNITEYIREEYQHIDATTLDQTLWMPAVTEAIINRMHLEEQLLSMAMEETKQDETKQATEFLVTRTISNSEVCQNLEDWAPSIKQEWQQLVQDKQAVKQITMSELQQLSQQRGVPIELLPGKTVHTRKAQSGAFRSRAVICGNYASSTD